jgi:hypothetical protein
MTSYEESAIKIINSLIEYLDTNKDKIDKYDKLMKAYNEFKPILKNFQMLSTCITEYLKKNEKRLPEYIKAMIILYDKDIHINEEIVNDACEFIKLLIELNDSFHSLDITEEEIASYQKMMSEKGKELTQ